MARYGISVYFIVFTSVIANGLDGLESFLIGVENIRSNTDILIFCYFSSGDR